ncbi:MAG TPA: hypothetical protein VF618_25135 [Thermoanaerobaculia bacterium]
MKEVYRKRGSVTRHENGWTIHVEESGVAVEEGATFECYPDTSAHPADPIRPISPIGPIPPIAPLKVERLIVTHGESHHEFAGRRWTDSLTRIHLSLVNGRQRVLIDAADFDDVDAIARAFAHCGADREAPKHLRLAPNVAAALVPFVEHRQSAGGVDGKGEPLVEGGTGWYRPSYRVRPMRMPMNVRALPKGEVDLTLPRAIALLAPVSGPRLHVLIEDGDDVYASVVRVEGVLAVGAETRWYPYAAGSFGAEMML